MANEITVQCALSAFKSTVMSAPRGMAMTGQFTMTGNFFSEGSLTVNTSATLFPLGSVASPHWSFFWNTDPTNFVTIRNGLTAADLVQLLAGEWCVLPLKTDATPYGVADTAAVIVQYLIVSL